MRMKRLTAPKTWPIERKKKKYVIAPALGPHPKEKSIPLGVVIRDILSLAQTLKEVKEILNKGLVKIDNKTRNDYKLPIGLMDVISIGKEYYRVLPSKKGFNIKQIGKDEASTKLVKIENKTCLKNKKIQLNMHDGKNMIVDNNDYRTGDVIVLDLDKNKVKEIIRLEKGCQVLLTGGNNIGKIGKMEDLVVTRSSQPDQILVALDDRKISLPKDYVFVIGKDKPIISLGDNNEKN